MTSDTSQLCCGVVHSSVNYFVKYLIKKFILLVPPSCPPKLARQGRAGEGGNLELIERATAVGGVFSLTAFSLLARRSLHA